jgi:large subunit ribosomal protein L5
MNRINYYTKTLFIRDFLFKVNPQNTLSIPTFDKIVLHTSINNSFIERKKILVPFLALEMISGQKPIKTRSKKFVSGFKIKKDQLLGYKVTLRDNQMSSFLEKFLNIVLPKLRDFQGFLYSSIDRRGSVTFGFKNFLFFPEIENHYEIFEALSGLQISFITNSKNGAAPHQLKQASLLLSMYQIPLIGLTTSAAAKP